MEDIILFANGSNTVAGGGVKAGKTNKVREIVERSASIE